MFRGATRTKTKTLKKGVSISRNVSLIDNYKQPVLTPNPGGQLHRNIHGSSIKFVLFKLLFQFMRYLKVKKKQYQFL